MQLHRFKIVVPNPEATSQQIKLRLEPAKPDEWTGYTGGKKGKSFKTIRAAIVPDPCSDEGKESLTLKLPPRSDVDVHIAIQTDGPGIGGFHIIDQRKGKDVGGVLLICSDPPLTDLPGAIVPARKPCPATLAKPLYAVKADDELPAAAAITPVAGGDPFDLVALITNPVRTTVTGVTAYLEHCGVGGAEFAAGGWNIGDLAPGDVFLATWRVSTTSSVDAVVVVSSDSCDPVRLSGSIKVKVREGRLRSHSG